jgi:SmpA / OmlA family
MITHTVQAASPKHGGVCRTTARRTATIASAGLPHVIALVIVALGMVSCAEFTPLPSDINRLQADLRANSELLAQISARVDQLERRQSISDHPSGQTSHELAQAIEVLLKKALLTEGRLTALESGELRSRVQVKPNKPVPQQRLNTSDAPHPEAVALSLGMTREEVRRILGEPVSTEMAGSYTIWQYSQENHQKYVIFENSSGQVWGWWGL